MSKGHDRSPTNGLSHVKGDESEPLLELTIPALLADTVAKFADHEAAIFSSQNIRWTYACLLYTSPSPRDLSTSRMPSSA